MGCPVSEEMSNNTDRDPSDECAVNLDAAASYLSTVSDELLVLVFL